MIRSKYALFSQVEHKSWMYAPSFLFYLHLWMWKRCIKWKGIDFWWELIEFCICLGLFSLSVYRLTRIRKAWFYRLIRFSTYNSLTLAHLFSIHWAITVNIALRMIDARGAAGGRNTHPSGPLPIPVHNSAPHLTLHLIRP